MVWHGMRDPNAPNIKIPNGPHIKIKPLPSSLLHRPLEKGNFSWKNESEFLNVLYSTDVKKELFDHYQINCVF